MSKAFFKSSVTPEAIWSYSAPKNSRSIEIWITTCIVTNFGRRQGFPILINPGNPQLKGCKDFPYFPRGGPVPKEKPMSMHKDWQPMGFVSQWGGMEVGTGMLYPVSVVDGLVHQLGGWRLQAECQWKRATAANVEICPVGCAVTTSSGGLLDRYDAIVHTTPPFFNYHDDPVAALSNCYQNALDQGLAKASRVATPLLGAGARGFPEAIAVQVAAKESRKWCDDEGKSEGSNGDEQVLAFALLEKRLAEELAAAIQGC